MRRTAQTAASPVPAHPGVDGHHSCRECPVCGTEECRVLAELGMYCETAQAAQESRAAEATPAGKAPRPAGARRP